MNVHGGAIAPLPNSIPRNRLFVCIRNTPVVDFFLHDASGAQILIQVSASCFREQKAKYDPKDEDIRVYGASALKPRAEARLENIYLTPNTSLMGKNPKYYRADVFLVYENYIRLFFLFVHIQSCRFVCIQSCALHSRNFLPSNEWSCRLFIYIFRMIMMTCARIHYS
jgi:hypothetical protein